MKEVIDLVDARLVEALQRNARLSLKELAKAAGVSVPTVRQRLRRLERLGIIRKYTVATDASRLEGRHRALVLLRLEPGAQEEGPPSSQPFRRCGRSIGSWAPMTWRPAWRWTRFPRCRSSWEGCGA